MEKTEKRCKQLRAEERATMMLMQQVIDTRRSLRSLGFRSPVEVYSELLHNMGLAKAATKH